MKSPWLVACDFNHYTAILTLRLTILMTDSLIIIFTCTWPLARRNIKLEAITIDQHHFCAFRGAFSPFQ